MENKLKKLIEIIGVENPNLESVLMALSCGGNWFIDDGGYFIRAKRKEFTYDYIIENDKNIKWKLGQPLDQQDPETLSFLHEILCK